jgi:hypothetical protein
MEVGNMDGEDTGGSEVFEVDVEGFPGEEVDGDGVAAEGIEAEDIEFMGFAASQFRFEGDAGIAEDHFGVAAAVFEVGEVFAGE